MPAFLKDLRRRSKTSFRRNPSSSDLVNGKTPKSGSTLSINSSSNNPSTPSEGSVGSAVNGKGVDDSVPPVPPRPQVNSAKRVSLYGSLTSPVHPPQRSPPPSPLAPDVSNVTNNSWVHQPIFLLYGTVGDPFNKPIDGTLWITHPHDGSPATPWEVCDSHYKALVYLQPGPNPLRLEFIPAKGPGNGIPNGPHASIININHLPHTGKPPLHLAIVVAKDSPLTFDAVPDRIQREGNGLDVATRKFKMAAYLWQAFTGEQMNRNGFARRCFRFDEEWQHGSLFQSDLASGQMRNEAKIHVIWSDKTVAEIRDLDFAQQYDKANQKGKLYEFAMDAVRNYFNPRPGQKHYVSCLLLDAHWDTKAKTIRGHAALGGGAGDIQLAIFGSHLLQNYPSCLEEVQPAFTDCTRTDTRFVANDCNEAGTTWEAANIGIGAHLHETGHLFGCPHQESGVMLRDYVKLNRTFSVREAPSSRTKSAGMRPCLQESECAWHRLDCLRFRFHPCFRLPSDKLPVGSEDTIQVWTVENDTVIATASKGIAWVELFAEGDDECHASVELFAEGNNITPLKASNQFIINEAELRNLLPPNRRQGRLKLEIHSIGQASYKVEDIRTLGSKVARLRLPDGRWGFRGGKLGFSRMEGSKPQEVILHSAVVQTKLLTSIRVYHGLCVDGVEFVYEDATSQLFGKRGGQAGGTEYVLDTRRGEVLLGFYLRAGLWIDGIQIISSTMSGMRKSEVFGNATGGSGHTLVPPRGYTIAGISGSHAAWLDGFSLIITR